MFSFLTNKLYNIYDRIKGISSLDDAALNSFFSIIEENLVDADVPRSIIEKINEEIKKRVSGVKLRGGVTVQEFLAREFHLVILHLLQGNYDKQKQKNFLKDFLVEVKQAKKPLLLMAIGLQGAGKTTTIGKLIHTILSNSYGISLSSEDLAVASLDYDRPAAQEQLTITAQTLGVEALQMSSVGNAIRGAQSLKNTLLEISLKKKIIIVDTAGRLSIDSQMMQELREVYDILLPERVLLVIDSMISQEGIAVATTFVETIPSDGVVITKTDSEARAGIILGITTLLSVPILYTTHGEKYSDITSFSPEKATKKLLGMGDLYELSERARQKISNFDEESIRSSIKRGDLSIDQFLKIIAMINQMGPLKNTLGMIPRSFLGGRDVKEQDISSIESFGNAIKVLALSMTKKEKKHPVLIQKYPSRFLRISQGAGIKQEEAKKVIDHFFLLREKLLLFKNFL
jgi:signal recognition particle subunit SRP54